MREQLTLTRLTPDMDSAYLGMVDEFLEAGEGYPYNNIPLGREDFAAYVRELEEEAKGIGLPPGVVPQTTYVLVRDGARVLGEIRFRPATQPPFRVGHDHIGYNVRPSERRRGYAGFMLDSVLKEAVGLGLAGVSLAVEGDNPASVALIQKYGGSALREGVDADNDEHVTIYWIPLVT
jgi:predicted acetyltransferase